MRYLLLALMIALLPLRGWVGNAMAVEMASQPTLQARADAKELSAMPEDCPMHAGAPTGSATDELAAADHCTDCTSCQLCLALASFSWSACADSSLTAAAGLPATGDCFSSAESRSRLRPPIS